MTLRAKFAMTRNQTPLVERVDKSPIAQKDWYIFFYNLYLAVTEGLPQEEESVTVTASPMIYTAVIRGQAHITGGTVSEVEFSRDGVNWYDVGFVEGFIQMDRTDHIRVTYTVAPVITFFPM